jgi:hypothetical protein
MQFMCFGTGFGGGRFGSIKAEYFIELYRVSELYLASCSQEIYVSGG